MQVIIHLDENDGLIFRRPTGEIALEDVALKDVPAGKPYIIIDEADVPDLTFMAAWVVDFSKPHGYGLGYDAFMKEHGHKLDHWKVVVAAYAENEAQDQAYVEMRDTADGDNAVFDRAYDEMHAVAERDNRQFDALQALKAAS